MIPKVTFTFDDGTKDHFTHAAPILEKYGYRGVFNVTTGYVTGEAKWDYPCLSADDVRALQMRGHEIASHTVHHVNMRDLWFHEGCEACRKELKQSYDDLTRMAGAPPAYFCYPFNRGCPMVSRLARKIGMEPYNPISRPNLGAYQWPKDHKGMKRELEQIIFSGKTVVDLMFHGVQPNGGWNSFEHEDDFEFLVTCIKEWEDMGRLLVSSYAAAHPIRHGLVVNLTEWLACMCWPLAYRIHLRLKGRCV